MIDLYALKQAMGDLNEEKMLAMINEFIASSPTEEQGKEVIEACQQGMNIVGDLFENGDYFVGDLIFAGEILTKAVHILKAIIGGSSSYIGTMVLGTVKGDLHDIGKNIFKSMAEAGGFKIHDLGIDVSPSKFVEAAKEIKPDIVAMSGVLTLALGSMKETVQALESAGIRNDLKVIIGGIPVYKEACEDMKADGFSHNAAEGVKICRSWFI